MNGFLLIDKPEGLTSHDVVARVRRLTGIRRVGHTGTLDPMATGVLPIAIGNAARMSEYMLTDDKIYTGSFRTGCISDTYDVAGDVRCSVAPSFTRDELAGLFRSMEGPCDQLPPMYSAKKVGGKKLYEFARRGETVERKPARITVHALQILKLRLPDVDFYAHVSKGTYIRSLVHEAGQALGCGAVLTSLRRVRSGTFAVDRCIPLQALETLSKEAIAAKLLPPDAAISYAPALHVTEEEGWRLANGQRLHTEAPDSALLRVYGDDRFLGPGRVRDRELKLIKVLEQKENV